MIRESSNIFENLQTLTLQTIPTTIGFVAGFLVNNILEKIKKINLNKKVKYLLNNHIELFYNFLENTDENYWRNIKHNQIPEIRFIQDNLQKIQNEKGNFLSLNFKLNMKISFFLQLLQIFHHNSNLISQKNKSGNDNNHDGLTYEHRIQKMSEFKEKTKITIDDMNFKSTLLIHI